MNLFYRSYLLGDVPLGDQDDDNVSGGGEGAAPQPIQARPPIPDIVDNDGGLGAVHQVISLHTHRTLSAVSLKVTSRAQNLKTFLILY